MQENASRKGDHRHALDRLVAAAAILLGASKAWSDPADHRVLRCADELERLGTAGPMPRFDAAAVTDAQDVWKKATGWLAKDTPTWGLWFQYVHPVGVADGVLWLTAPAAVAAWIERRYQARLEEAGGVVLRIVQTHQRRRSTEGEDSGNQG